LVGNWRRLHSEELHNVYIIGLIKSRKMRWAGNVAQMGEISNGYDILIGKLEVKRPFGRTMRGS
jgi:hypothetical protein